MQVIVQPTEVSKLVESLEEEDSADEDSTVFRSTLCSQRQTLKVSQSVCVLAKVEKETADLPASDPALRCLPHHAPTLRLG